MENIITSENTLPAEIAVPVAEFRHAMRELTGAVCVITVGSDEDRTGFVATSVSSFSAEPPRLIVCIDRKSSSWTSLCESGRFGVNFMREDDALIASHFAGFAGLKGKDRYASGEWIALDTGTQVLKNALASIDCVVEETLDRHDHAIVLGKVDSIRICDSGKPLLWFKSAFHRLGDPLV